MLQLSRVSMVTSHRSAGLVGRSSANASSVLTLVQHQTRSLAKVRSQFGYGRFGLGKQSGRKYLYWRQPNYFSLPMSFINAPYYWQSYVSRNPDAFLPKDNYVWGNFTNVVSLEKDHIYTIRHCASGLKFRLKRFPNYYEFHQHTRWNIGKPLGALQHSKTPASLVMDWDAMSKRYKIGLQKRGILPQW